MKKHRVFRHSSLESKTAGRSHQLVVKRRSVCAQAEIAGVCSSVFHQMIKEMLRDVHQKLNIPVMLF